MRGCGAQTEDVFSHLWINCIDDCVYGHWNGSENGTYKTYKTTYFNNCKLNCSKEVQNQKDRRMDNFVAACCKDCISLPDHERRSKSGQVLLVHLHNPSYQRCIKEAETVSMEPLPGNTTCPTAVEEAGMVGRCQLRFRSVLDGGMNKHPRNKYLGINTPGINNSE